MCGRFSLAVSPEDLASHFSVAEVPTLSPRYNIAPSQPVLAVQEADSGAREITHFRWGLVPSWSKAFGQGWINARAETAAEKPSFKAALRRRRCLIPTDGFYEWKGSGKRKQPYFIHLHTRPLFAFAGIWDHWQGADGSEFNSCAILTTQSHGPIQELHPRIPMILNPEAYTQWLDRQVQDPRDLAFLWETAYPQELKFYPVSTLVNSPKHEDPECRQPLDPGLLQNALE
ncbi:MAG: SOS response-associated peptidase [Synechococcaceae cyanobacterium SM2_3_1]|nr:SOS response-associated peptidase [Synechococcaceae cyanobacterium SM2_3_1]